MSIYDQIQDLYTKTGWKKGTFEKDLTWYLQHGYVFATPEYFIMGVAISGGWYVHAAVGVGALEGFLRLMPYYLPYVGWERRGSGKVRWYPTEKLKQRLI